MPKPFFSVVIPTRNRSSWLGYSTRSVLSQSFKDLELIISDNYSTDETPAVVNSLKDPRVKYFRSSRSLSLSESWEFALSHAQGEHLIFLSDDDAQATVFLETLAGLIESEKADVTSCKLITYYGAEKVAGGQKISANSLFVKPFTNKTFVFNREQAVKTLFDRFNLTTDNDGYPFISFPQLVNASYSMKLLKKVQERIPQIFMPMASDVYTAALFLNAADSFCYTDKPLYVNNDWTGSLTSGEADFFKKCPEATFMEHVPNKTLNFENYTVNLLLRARADWGADFYPVEISWEKYHRLHSVKRRIKSKLRTIPLINKLKSPKPSAGKILNGYKNILECSQQIDNGFLEKLAAEFNPAAAPNDSNNHK